MADTIVVILSIGVPVIASVFGWFVNMLREDIQDLKEENDDINKRFDAHRLYAAETFITKNDLSQIKAEILEHLNRIENKLDRKADKS